MTKKSPRRDAWLDTMLITILALGLYLPFLAVQYDINGIAEAVALEARLPINKNHIVYRSVGLVVFRLLQAAGYEGNSLVVLQVINAFCGAAGVGLAYAVFKRTAGARAAAILGSFWLATSFSYWVFSTDAAYITVAAFFLLSAIACIEYGRSIAAVAAAAVFASLSILT